MSTDHHGTGLARFLRARRTQVTPVRVGLPSGLGLRRTPGLRREELAILAGVSVDYYTRLERGKETHPSPGVIDSLARALRLEPDEHEHLRQLAARAAGNIPKPAMADVRAVRPGVEILLENLRPSPAYVLSRALDVLAANPGGLRLYAGIDDWPAERRNLARYYFLHPAARDLLPDWDDHVRGCIARLRALAGTEPDAPDLAELVGELFSKSADFARLWERYDVRAHRRDTKRFRHPEVGGLTLGYQSMQLDGTAGQRVVAHFAEVASADHDAVIRLDDAPAAPHTADRGGSRADTAARSPRHRPHQALHLR